MIVISWVRFKPNINKPNMGYSHNAFTLLDTSKRQKRDKSRVRLERVREERD